MPQETNGPSPDPCAPSLKSELLTLAQGEDLKLPQIKPPIDGSPSELAVTEPPKSALALSLTTPVTKAPRAQNGTPHEQASNGYSSKKLSLKKQNSKPRLEKQSSGVSSNESEPPILPPGAREDCCVHCALAILFCQFLSMCHLLLDVVSCGSCSADSAELCCSCCCSMGCPDCSDSCADCGIVDACCESADCLEICMECCGLCFSS